MIRHFVKWVVQCRPVWGGGEYSLQYEGGPVLFNPSVILLAFLVAQLGQVAQRCVPKN